MLASRAPISAFNPRRVLGFNPALSEPIRALCWAVGVPGIPPGSKNKEPPF